MTTVPTTPKSEQIQFRSEKTGTHNLDTYLEACELGTAPNVKTLPNVCLLYTSDAADDR